MLCATCGQAAFLNLMRCITIHDQGDEESRKKMGSFLFHSQLQTSMHSSALFLTGAAQVSRGRVCSILNQQRTSSNEPAVSRRQLA